MDPKFAQPQNVTTAEIIKFFSGTGVDPKCPSCKNGSASIQVDDTQQQVRIIVNEYVEVQPSGGFVRTSSLMHPAILTACDNCGYIRTFSLHKVNTWLNTQDPSRGKPE